jgi:hypothetical protein
MVIVLPATVVVKPVKERCGKPTVHDPTGFPGAMQIVMEPLLP